MAVPATRAVVVGLGNPWLVAPSNSRHNFGVLQLSALAKRLGEPALKWQFTPSLMAWTAAYEPISYAPVAEGGGLVRLVWPALPYNAAGFCAQRALARFGCEPSRLLVLHDDLETKWLKSSFKTGGSESGNRGLKSISAAVGTREYRRLRLGIGRPAVREGVVQHVLERLPAEEMQSVHAQMLEPNVQRIIDHIALES